MPQGTEEGPQGHSSEAPQERSTSTTDELSVSSSKKPGEGGMQTAISVQ